MTQQSQQPAAMTKSHVIPERTVTTAYGRHGPVRHEPLCCGLCAAAARRDALGEALRTALLECGYPPDEQHSCPNHGALILKLQDLVNAAAIEKLAD